MKKATNSLYMQIYLDVRNDILAGMYDNNQKLPTESDLAKKYFVSRITSKKAMNMLADENIIIRVKGRGSYVAPHLCREKLKSKDGEKKVIGIILSDVSNSFGQGILLRIEKECREHGYLCLFFRSDGDQDVEQQTINSMIECGVSGIIIIPVHGVYYNPTILRLVLDGFPIVVVDRDLRGIPTNFVGTDNVAAAKALMDYLIELGHTKISIYSLNTQKTSSLEDRMEGARQSMEEHGISIPPHYFFTEICSALPGNYTQENAAKDHLAIKAHLKNNPEITAIFAMEYQVAVMVKMAAKELGILQNMVITCFDSPRQDKRFAFYNEPAYEFAHIRQDEDRIGEEAFRLLLSIMSTTADKEATKIFLPYAIYPSSPYSQCP